MHDHDFLHLHQFGPKLVLLTPIHHTMDHVYRAEFGSGLVLLVRLRCRLLFVDEVGQVPDRNQFLEEVLESTEVGGKVPLFFVVRAPKLFIRSVLRLPHPSVRPPEERLLLDLSEQDVQRLLEHGRVSNELVWLGRSALPRADRVGFLSVNRRGTLLMVAGSAFDAMAGAMICSAPFCLSVIPITLGH